MVMPMPSTVSTAPACADQRMRLIGADSARGASTLIGVDSRNLRPAGDWM
jgi:hypothetical protein